MQGWLPSGCSGCWVAAAAEPGVEGQADRVVTFLARLPLGSAPLEAQPRCGCCLQPALPIKVSNSRGVGKFRHTTCSVFGGCRSIPLRWLLCLSRYSARHCKCDHGLCALDGPRLAQTRTWSFSPKRASELCAAAVNDSSSSQHAWKRKMKGLGTCSPRATMTSGPPKLMVSPS